MERAEKAKSPEMETAGLPPNDMKRFYVNGRHLLREIAGLSTAAAEGQFPGRPAEVIDQDNWAKSFDCEYKR